MKKKVISEIQTHLAQELAALMDSREQADIRKADEIQRLLMLYKFLPVRDYSGENDVVCPAALVELELGGTRTFCFIVPQGGGLVMRVDGKPVQVITPHSPLGAALLGKKAGDQVKVETANRGFFREYRIVALA